MILIIPLDLTELISCLPSPLPTKILLQTPEGIQPQILAIVKAIEDHAQKPIIVYVTGDACYGACDLAVNQADQLQVELIIHIGHTSFNVPSKIPVIYYPIDFPLNYTVLEHAMAELPEHKIYGLATTAQYLQELPTVQKILKQKGLSSVIGRGSARVAQGQILGCDYSSCTSIQHQVDAFLYIGNGVFHPLGIMFSTGRVAYGYDPRGNNIEVLTDYYERFRRKRIANIVSARNARTFGLILSLKPGQIAVNLAEALMTQLQNIGKRAVILVFNEIRSDRLLNMPEIDAFIDLACPRIALDDEEQYERPILTPDELAIALEQKEFDDVYPTPTP